VGARNGGRAGSGDADPLRGILPSTRFEAGYIRTTDPIGAFGTLLRQRVIGQDDFAPSRLNYPAVASNYTGAVVLEQPLFNADALAGRRAARRASQAAEASTEWTALATRVDIVRAYYGATLAREKVATLSASVRAAREHVRRAEAMARNGLVTSSDALLAAVKAGDVEAMLVEAEGDAANAILALATAMGDPTDTSFALPSTLPGSEAVRQVANDALQASDVARSRTSAPRVRGPKQPMPTPFGRAPCTCRASMPLRATTGTRPCALSVETTTGVQV
jgi:outer membrane protein TolC